MADHENGLKLPKGQYRVFIIWGYSERLSNGDMTDVTEFQLVDTNYKDALNRAKLLYGKKNYLLKTVVENFKK